MTSHETSFPPRATDLLCDRALWGLDPAEAAELEQILREGGKEDDLSFELAAAAADLAYGAAAGEALPARLERTVLGSAIAHVANQRGVPKVVPITKRKVPTWVPWLAAAACFILAIGGWLRTVSAPATSMLRPSARAADPGLRASRGASLADRRKALVEGGARVASWSASEDRAAKGASGDVVWDNQSQEGYMRFHGLATNDPRENQYQLWIFDKTQDQRYPVDGGVFDVDETTGDVIVAIRPKLRVVDPTLFAVTVEKPGGVVVSSRERIVLTANAVPG